MSGDRRLLVCAAVLAGFQAELVSGLTPGWNPEPNMCEDELPPWTTADMHTAHGKRALYTEAKKYRMAPEAFSQLWFLMESGRVDRTSHASVWWDAFIEYKLMEHGFESVEQARTKWEEIMPGLRDLVIRLCDADSWSFSG